MIQSKANSLLQMISTYQDQIPFLGNRHYNLVLLNIIIKFNRNHKLERIFIRAYYLQQICNKKIFKYNTFFKTLSRNSQIQNVYLSDDAEFHRIDAKSLHDTKKIAFSSIEKQLK